MYMTTYECARVCVFIYVCKGVGVFYHHLSSAVAEMANFCVY